ncbi:Sterol 3-beta-glucosyltransferase UGT80A2 [Glycine soja]
MERRKPKAVFMAFGTKGDVYPLAAIAAAFARDQKQYDVMLITHSAHESLSTHLAEKHVQYCPVSSPPVLCADQNNDTEGKAESSFFLQKKKVTRDLRQECYALIERIFGDGPGLDGDLIVINFFALEGWSLAESFCVRCIVAAPYVVPYSAPATFESQFQIELPLLYKYLIDAPSGKVCWKDVIHWMWPLFTENWGSWRNDVLHLSPCPFTDPVTGIPTWHDRPQSPLVMYGFSKEVVECPARYEPLESIVRTIAAEASFEQKKWSDDCVPLCNGRLLCFSGSVPYGWLFPKCAAVIHHGGSGTTAAALQAGTPQVVCPFILDQFYWAERMHWLGVSPEPLSRNHLLPDKNDNTSIHEAARVLSLTIHDALSSTVKARAAEIAERILLEMAHAKTYMVGGEFGWNYTVNMTTWPNGKSFRTGDILGWEGCIDKLNQMWMQRHAQITDSGGRKKSKAHELGIQCFNGFPQKPMDVN